MAIFYLERNDNTPLNPMRSNRLFGYLLWILLLLPAIAPAQTVETHYLSDEDPIYKELEHLQDTAKNNFFDRTPGAQVFDHSAIKQYLTHLAGLPIRTGVGRDTSTIILTANSIDSIYSLYFTGTLTTRYQEPITYFQMARMIQLMRPIVQSLYPENTYAPKFGTLFTSELMTERRAVKDDYLLLQHFPFLRFCQETAKYALFPILNMGYPRPMGDGIFYYVDPRALEQNISRDTLLWKDFFRFMILMQAKKPMVNKRVAPNPESLVYFQMLTTAMEWFATAHEYGHAIKKHDMSYGPDTLSDEWMIHSWENEIESDHIGLQILLQWLATDTEVRWRGSGTFMEWGAVFFLDCLFFYEDVPRLIKEHRDIPALTDREINTLLKIVDKKRPMPQRIALLRQVNKEFLQLDHPPTEFRMYLLEKELDDHQTRKLRSIADPNWQSQEIAMYRFGQDILHSLDTLFSVDRHLFILTPK